MTHSGPIAAFAGFLMLIVSVYLYVLPASAQGAGEPISGYAWSDTIGWISFNCSNHNSCATNNYGFTVDGSGNISGYAWSENIGWISANSADLVGCPTTPCSARFDGSSLKGWLKVLSGGSAQSGGWDGWIGLSGTNPTYGPALSEGAFAGFAWGDTNLGWVDFQYAASTFTPDVCPNISGVQSSPPQGYVLSGGICIPACTEAYSCSGNTIQHTNASCEVSNVATCVSPGFCSAGASSCLYPPPSYVSSEGHSGHLEARPNLVRQGESTRLYWSLTNVESCTVTGSNGDSFTGASSGSNGQVTSAIVQQTFFTLSCTGLDASLVSGSAVVNMVPIFQER